MLLGSGAHVNEKNKSLFFPDLSEAAIKPSFKGTMFNRARLVRNG